MLAFNRFRVPEAGVASFRERAETAVGFFRSRPGCLDAQVVRNLDEPDLWAIVSRWENVGAYRRSFNGYEAKFVLVSLLSEALDEPGAFGDPEEVGENVPRSG